LGSFMPNSMRTKPDGYTSIVAGRAGA